jgi:purine-binding chemotaxis protein CheW
VSAPAALDVDAPGEAPAGGEALVVRLGAGRLAIALEAVAEVGRVPATARVPGAPEWLAGVANWRGRLLPVLDIRPMLGVEAGPVDRWSRIVLVVADNLTVGLLVDAVEGTDVAGDRVEELPAAVTGPAAALLAGQIPHDDGPLGVLDVDALLRLRETLPHARRSG